jgi:lipopolysaccharide/colanic/teichoic acid biosynthesis glycosyltransferase
MSAVVGRDILPFEAGAVTGQRVRTDRARRVISRWAEQPGAGWYAYAKIAIDTTLAAVLMLVTAPFLLLAAVLVKLTSRGPVFYSQTRLGWGGRPFTLYKVRSMIHDCERLTGPQWSRPGDPRVTRVGRFLRATHLDELPQLWNVFKGDMSLIGPRPERPEIAANLDRLVPHYRGRLLVRPGLSGLAQVQLPADTDLASVRLKLAYDLYYVHHLSFSLDLGLMLATICYLLGIPFALARRVCRIPSGEVVERPYRRWLQLGAEARAPGQQSGPADGSQPTRQAYGLDMSKFGEPELQALAEECGYHPAAIELALRYCGLKLA